MNDAPKKSRLQAAAAGRFVNRDDAPDGERLERGLFIVRRDDHLELRVRHLQAAPAAIFLNAAVYCHDLSRADHALQIIGVEPAAIEPLRSFRQFRLEDAAWTAP